MNLYVPDNTGQGELPGIFPSGDMSLTRGLPPTETTWPLSTKEIWKTFFARTPGLEYLREALPFMRIVTFPNPTSTAAEKAIALDLTDSEAYLVVKTLLWRDKKTGEVVMTIAPDLGRVNLKVIPRGKHLRPIPPDELPWGMEHGICTPFIPLGADVARIVFDSGSLELGDSGFYDFSIVLAAVPVDNHRLSVQMPYAVAYELLSRHFSCVKALDLLQIGSD